MSKFTTSAIIALCGLATSLTTVAIVTLFNVWTGHNIFTFSIWVVIPVGAIGCGFASASGYYLAAKFLHQRPTKILLTQMVLIAALTQISIYWAEYKTLFIDGKNISEFISFSQYIDIIFTKVHMKFGRTLAADAGEVGQFGYWLAAFNFIGFMVGGISVYLYLKALPTCDVCDRYLRKALKKEDSFSDSYTFSEYYDHVYSNPLDSPEFASHVGREFSAGKAQKGSINLTTQVFECPQCFAQAIMETVQISNGSEFKEVEDLKRFISIPQGIDVRQAFLRKI